MPSYVCQDVNGAVGREAEHAATRRAVELGARIVMEVQQS